MLTPEQVVEATKQTQPADPWAALNAIRQQQRPAPNPRFTGPYLNIAALCPTYRRIRVVENTVALWEMQDYPAAHRRLIILDDGGTWRSQKGQTWEVFSVLRRFPSMPAKYAELVTSALWSCPWEPDAYLIWDDDDIYLPGYVTAHARTLLQHEFSSPFVNWTHYGPDLMQQPKHWHAADGFRRELGERVGWWPEMKRMWFDRAFQNTLRDNARSTGEPWDNYWDAQFVMGFSDTGAHHSSNTPESDNWYDEHAKLVDCERYVGTLVPTLDDRLSWVQNEIRRQGYGL